jgi:hypothetical protein
MAIQNTEVALWATSVLQFLAAVVAVFVRDPWWKGWLIAAAAANVLLVTLYGLAPVWICVLLVAGVFVGLWWAYGVEFRKAEPDLGCGLDG